MFADMPKDALAFMIALIAANLFFILRFLPRFSLRPFLKAAMAAALAAMCFLTETPLLWMGVGFCLSALGDFFLDLEGKTWFLPGLFAFFAAHLAFIAYLAPHMLPFANFSGLEWAISGGLIVATLAFFIWLKPSLPKNLVLPVALYSLVIVAMGGVAMTTTLESILIPIGALLFILSDMVLAIDKFKTSHLAMGKQINWALYAAGQIMLALGTIWSI